MNDEGAPEQDLPKRKQNGRHDEVSPSPVLIHRRGSFGSSKLMEQGQGPDDAVGQLAREPNSRRDTLNTALSRLER